MQVKIRPYNLAVISFPGFQKIADFTSAGSESSLAVTVNSTVDKQYIIHVANKNTTQGILFRLNNDSGANYGYTYLRETSAATITSASGSTTSMPFLTNTEADYRIHLQCPTSLKVMAQIDYVRYASGIVPDEGGEIAMTYNSTSNITTLDFISASGNFASGSRILVYARRP